MNDKKLEARLVYNGNWKAYRAEYPLVQDITTIGRLDHSDIVLPDDCVTYVGEGHDDVGFSIGIRTSRRHARIVREKDGFVLEDLGSKVGTFVNGIKLGEPQLEPWKVRFCHSADYYSKREPQIIERNKGRAILKDGDIITLGMEIYPHHKHEFVFRNS